MSFPLEKIQALITRNKRLDILFALAGLVCLGIAIMAFVVLFVEMAISGYTRLNPDFFINLDRKSVV